MLGGHMIKAWSSTQPNITLFSGEAEFVGVTRAAAVTLGIRSLLTDLGARLKPQLWTDSSAAIGICKRRGLGKVRHLAVADLWIQDHLRSNDFALTKVKGSDNPADALTKFVDKATLDKHLAFMTLECIDGRAESAPQID